MRAAAPLLACTQVAGAAFVYPDDGTPGTISFKQLGVCASGQPAYIGFITPWNLTEPDKFSLEIMGGAMCFSKESCEDPLLYPTMDLKTYLTKFLGMPGELYPVFASGASLPLTMLAAMRPGFLPYAADHPMANRRVVYMPSCGGDISIGRHNCSYTYSSDTHDNMLIPTDLKASFSKACKARAECGSSDDKLGEFETLEECYAACEAVEGCRYVIFGYGDKAGKCYQEKTADRTCPEGWERHYYYFFDITNPPECSVDNEPPTNAYHHGGKHIRELLEAVKIKIPNLSEFAIYGGSGGGVATSLWAPLIADTFPNANVLALVDSGFHMFPGTKTVQGTESIYHYFHDHVCWTDGPAGTDAPKYNGVVVPSLLDWADRSAIPKTLQHYDGRLKIAYISCLLDHVVLKDRKLIERFTQYEDSIDQAEEVWAYMNNLHQVAPPGTAFSYIMDCDNHAWLRSGDGSGYPGPFPDNDGEGDITSKQFVFNFLTGSEPDEGGKRHFWCCGKDLVPETAAPTAPLPVATTSPEEPTNDTTGAITDTATSPAARSEHAMGACVLGAAVAAMW